MAYYGDESQSNESVMNQAEDILPDTHFDTPSETHGINAVDGALKFFKQYGGDSNCNFDLMSDDPNNLNVGFTLDDPVPLPYYSSNSPVPTSNKPAPNSFSCEYINHYNGLMGDLGLASETFAVPSVSPPFSTSQLSPAPPSVPKTTFGIAPKHRAKPPSKSTAYRLKANGPAHWNGGKAPTWAKWAIYGNGAGPWYFTSDNDIHRDQLAVVRARAEHMWPYIEASTTYKVTKVWPDKTEEMIVARVLKEYVAWRSHQLQRYTKANADAAYAVLEVVEEP
ncbi:hypothetical protein T484DRAFT_1745704 [Baffinella frigidus]|nr:hypothetical protein T484DRAFT_1745704 [Cryptophyta sp. CCMP2293]